MAYTMANPVAYLVAYTMAHPVAYPAAYLVAYTMPYRWSDVKKTNTTSVIVERERRNKLLLLE